MGNLLQKKNLSSINRLTEVTGISDKNQIHKQITVKQTFTVKISTYILPFMTERIK